MMNGDQSQEKQREERRQKELKNNPIGTLSTGANRSTNASFTDLTGGLSWKVTDGSLLVLVLGIILYRVFFN